MLNSQIKKLEKLGLKVNCVNNVNGFNVFIETCMNSSKFYASVSKPGVSGSNKVLCTRANFDTAYNKIVEFLKENSN